MLEAALFGMNLDHPNRGYEVVYMRIGDYTRPNYGILSPS